MKAVAALMLTAVVFLTAGCNKSDDPNNEGNNNGGDWGSHDYVNLGLPSGTLWATCNNLKATLENSGEIGAGGWLFCN